MSHPHGHTEDVDWSGMIDALSLADDVEQELNARIAASLVTGRERLVVDIGCGAGGMTAALRAAAAGARVVAVDAEPALLAATLRRAGDVETLRADLAQSLPGEVDGADLIWASAVVHHLPDQQVALSALAARLAPGGRLALGEGGLRPRSLPWDLGVGEPGLELRLDAAGDRWFAQMRRDIPGSVPMAYGWPTALHRAGLVDVAARSFLLDLPAPLADPAAAHVIGRLRALLERPGLGDEVEAADRATLRRLTDPGDDLRRGCAGELFLLAARTVYVGSATSTHGAGSGRG